MQIPDLDFKRAALLDVHELAKLLNTNLNNGLTAKEAESRFTRFGANIISNKKDKSAIDIFIKQFKNPLVYILIFAFVLSATFFSAMDAAVIFLALALNVGVGFFQERKADNIYKNLSEELTDKASVLRDAKMQKIDAKHLTVGDIVILEAGKKVPADARVFDVQNLKVDESALTGESKPVEKKENIDDVLELSDASTLVFAGTLITDGMAKAIVYKVGDKTEFGKIAQAIDTDEKAQTPIQKQIAKLSRIIATVMIFVSVSIVALAFSRGMPIEDIALLTIALAVASIPEGLPAAISVALAVGMERILKKGGLVKYPAAAEALGSVDFILTDKTGTLTSGNMRLVNIKTISTLNKKEFELNLDVKETLKLAVLASDAFVEIDENQKASVHGRPIERAILSAGIENDLRQDTLFANGFGRLDFVPFSSQRRFAISLNKDPERGHKVILSGAPEALIELSEFVLQDGQSVKFTDEMKKELYKKQEEYSKQALRLTAVAFSYSSNISEELKNPQGKKMPMIFAGLLLFEDEIRDSAISAVEDAKKMGTEVLMVTGDHSTTALAIAQKVGIANSPEQVIKGVEFEKLKDKEILSLINGPRKKRVFARMLPNHKKRLAQVLQKAGNSIAMTGDGINDAPALSIANIGIAVESGTDVAKAAADMILLKSSFASISFAIKEGRRVLVNIYKTIIYLLSTAVGEVVLIAVALLFGGPVPLLPSQLLWHNIIEGGLMNFPFAFDKDVKNTGRLAKDKEDFERKNYLFTAYLAVVFPSVLLFLYAFMLQLKYDITHLRTVLFVTFSTTGFFLALSLKNVYKPVWKTKLFSNPYLNIALSVNMILLLVVFAFEFTRNFLGISIPNKFDIYLILAAALFKWFAIEFGKWLFFKTG